MNSFIFNKKLSKIFIIGASGSVGTDLFNFFEKNKYNVFGTAFKNKKKKYIYLNLNNKNKKFIKNINNKDILIFNSAYTDKNWIEKNKEKSKKLNLDSTINFLKEIKKINCKIIFMSSVEVFDGKIGNYKESQNPQPISYYGKNKLLIEKFITKNFINFTIIRTGWIVTNSMKSNRCIIVNIYKNILDNDAKLASDNFINILSSEDLFKYILFFLTYDKCLIMHLSSGSKISRVKIANYIKKLSKFSKSMQFKLIKHKDLKDYDKIPQNNYLNCELSNKITKIKKDNLKKILFKKIKMIEKI